MTSSTSKREGEEGSSSRSNSSAAKRRDRKPDRTGQEPDHPCGRPNDHPLWRLQRTHGNQTVQRAVKEQGQLEFELGQPDDEYEREADRMADQVMQSSFRTTSAISNSRQDDATESAVRRRERGGDTSRGGSLARRETDAAGAVQPVPLAASITPIVQRARAVQREDADSTPRPSRTAAPLALPPLPRTRLPLSAGTAELLGIGSFEGFGIDQSEPEPELRERMERRAAELADLLESAPPGGVLVVEGHTDATGTEQHNEMLGLERAEAVRRILEGAGVPADLIQTHSRGETQLAVETRKHNPRNRRVTVRLRAPPQGIGFGIEGLSEPLSDPSRVPSPRGLFPTWRDLLDQPRSPEEEAERNLEQMLREGGPPPVPFGQSFDDILDSVVDDFSDDLADSFHIKNEFARDQLHNLVRRGVEAGLGAGIDAGMDRLGLEGEEREAVEKTIEALRQVRPGEGPDESGGERIQRAPTLTPTFDRSTLPADTAQQIDAARSGGGRPLPLSELNYFEARFGTAFDGVRVHTDQGARAAADTLNARAFTVGSDIIFGVGEYRPGTSTGRQLLAHELTHVVQQGADGVVSSMTGGGSAAVQRDEEGDVNQRLRVILDKIRNDKELTQDEIESLSDLSQEEVEYIKDQIGQEIVRQVVSRGPQILINYDPASELQDFERHVQGRLNLRLGGIFGAVAGSLEGEAEADIDVVATASNRTIVITISEPRGANRMAAIIRERLFPTGRPRQFDFELSEQVYRMVGALSLVGSLKIALVGTETESSGTMITLHHESIPNDIELLVTLTTATGRTRTEESEDDVPSDYSLLTPNPRAFAAGGYSRSGGRHSLVGTAGVDVPLMYSTENPLAYVGLGLRGSVGTAGSGRLGGSAFVGLNLDPLTLQFGVGVGAVFLPESITTPEGPAQTILYEEAEGMIGYRVASNLELLMMATVGGEGEYPGYVTSQVGAAFRF